MRWSNFANHAELRQALKRQFQHFSVCHTCVLSVDQIGVALNDDREVAA